MLLRGQNLLGYRHYADDVVEKFVAKSVENGVGVVRVFDALNDPRNLEVSMRAIKKYGGVLKGEWVYGMVVCSEKGESEYMWSRDNFLFTDKPCKKINPGYPLDSFAVSLSKRRYLAYIAKEEEERLERSLTESMVIDFIVRCVK